MTRPSNHIEIDGVPYARYCSPTEHVYHSEELVCRCQAETRSPEDAYGEDWNPRTTKEDVDRLARRIDYLASLAPGTRPAEDWDNPTG